VEPGIFSVSGTGSGLGAILNENGSLNSPANPAPRGTIIQIFGTGGGRFGETLDGSVLGAPVSIPYPVYVRFNNSDFGEVLYAGSTPGLISSLWQVNVRIPMTMRASEATPILVDIGGKLSQSGVTVAAQ
jgi:uncharacterized protein (TIGR03437 family)